MVKIDAKSILENRYKWLSVTGAVGSKLEQYRFNYCENSIIGIGFFLIQFDKHCCEIVLVLTTVTL